MKKLLRCLAVATAAFGIAASVGGQALAAYPDKQVRLVVPYPPGTGTDKVARYTAMRLEKALGQGVVVENRAGGSAIVAARQVVSSAPDGYTLLFAANGPVTTNVALFKELPYDPVKDLAPVARLAFGPMGVFVPADSPYQTAEELFEATRKSPGELNYGSGSATYHIAGEWLMSLVGGKSNIVAYKGAAPALTDLAGGQIDFTIADYSGALPLMDGKRIRMLAATIDKRLPAQPSLPTVQELGYKDFFQVAWWGVFTPAGVPEDIRNKLEKTLLDIYADAETQQFLDSNHYLPFLGTAEELRKFQVSEIERESRLVQEFGIPRQ